MTTVHELKDKVKIFRPKSQKVNLFDTNLNDNSTRLFKFKDDQNNNFKIWIFTDTFKLETPLETCLLFSINYPDRVCLANKRLKEIKDVGIVYTDNSRNDQIQSCLSLLYYDLLPLKFDKNEGLTVYRNSLQLTLKHDRQLLPEIETCIKLKSLIEQNFPDKANEADYSDLPISLRQLLLKYKNFVITDDFERDNLINELSIRQRDDLIKSVEPKLDEIYLFLDNFAENSLTEGAFELQSLAELTIELTNNEKKNKRKS